MSFWKIVLKIWWYKLFYLIFTPLGSGSKQKIRGLDPDPYGHFWDPGSGSAWKLMRIRNTAFIILDPHKNSTGIAVVNNVVLPFWNDCAAASGLVLPAQVTVRSLFTGIGAPPPARPSARFRFIPLAGVAGSSLQFFDLPNSNRWGTCQSINYGTSSLLVSELC